MASSKTQYTSHEDYVRKKELEEARKAGVAPAAVDEDGKEINPHIPQYMSSAPWYLNSDHPTLKHQKDWRESLKDDRKFYDRGAKTFQAKKYRKGACENCGAMSHKSKDCVERPRKKGAKWTNSNIQADEKIQEIQLETYDAKQDRWNGYDVDDYSKVMDLYEKSEQARMDKKRQETLERLERGEDIGDIEKENDDEDKIDETEEAGFGQVEKRVRTTGGGATGSVRNLRIREDTAKYLYNLDPESAHYDPKSRSMRADPLPHLPANQKTFMGDNFTRESGDFYGLQSLTVHSLQAQKFGSEIHPQAAPSQAEALHRQFLLKKAKLENQSKADVAEKYGNVAKVPDEEETSLIFGQTEGYVEYTKTGRVLKGQEVKVRSKYEEDIYPGNHTSIWGSFWESGSWGYACCHQLSKHSYCTGEDGKLAARDNLEQQRLNMENLIAEKKAAEDSLTMPPPPPKKMLWGSETDKDVTLDKAKLAEEMKKQDKLLHSEEEDERKRKYNSLSSSEGVTEEEMEAYRLTRNRFEDPMPKPKDGYDYV